MEWPLCRGPTKLHGKGYIHQGTQGPTLHPTKKDLRDKNEHRKQEKVMAKMMWYRHKKIILLYPGINTETWRKEKAEKCVSPNLLNILRKKI